VVLPAAQGTRISVTTFSQEAEMAADLNTRDGTPPTVYVDRRLAAGSAALIGAGLLAGMAGATVGAVAVVRACRRYIADMAEPPQVAARRRWRQARSASAAGVGAWQQYSRQARPEAVR
jgi:hypothetical protein